jgi:hypothetical protein
MQAVERGAFAISHALEVLWAPADAVRCVVRTMADVWALDVSVRQARSAQGVAQTMVFRV